MTPVIQVRHDGHGLARDGQRFGLRNGDVNQRMDRQTLSPEGGQRSRDPANRADPLVAPRDRVATWAKANRTPRHPAPPGGRGQASGGTGAVPPPGGWRRVAKLSDCGEREDASVGAKAALASGGRLRRNGLAGNSKDQVISPTLGRTPRGFEPAKAVAAGEVREGFNNTAESRTSGVASTIQSGPPQPTSPRKINNFRGLRISADPANGLRGHGLATNGKKRPATRSVATQ